MNGILLDTCALIWFGAGQGLTTEGEARLRSDYEHGRTPFLSPISAWELGMLQSKGRVSLTLDAEDWLAAFLERTGTTLLDLSPRILIRSSQLPGSFHGDPADRIIAASAREHGLSIFTRDHAILQYANAGFVAASAC